MECGNQSGEAGQCTRRFVSLSGGVGCVTDFADLASACENLVKLQNTGGMFVLYFL